MNIENMPSGFYLRSAGLDELAFENLKDIGYFDAPASNGHHLAEKGGLVTHSVNVTRELLKLTETMGESALRQLAYGRAS